MTKLAIDSEAKPRVLNNSPVDNSGFPKTSEVEFRGFLRDPEVTEPQRDNYCFGIEEGAFFI